jgi:hypothetical protein
MTIGSHDLAGYLEQLVERTREGGIGWSPVSPSAYAALRETPSGRKRMTLTRAPRRQRNAVDDYIAPGRIAQADLLFQVEALDAPGKRIELAIDTREKPELGEVFDRLYDAARLSVDAQSARILKELVG